MSIRGELTSFNFNLYAQLCGLLSCVLVIVLSAATAHGGIWYRVLGIIYGIIIFFIEIPIFGKLVPSGGALENIFGGKKRAWWRCFLYIGFAATMWAAVNKGNHPSGVSAWFLTMTALFYLAAGIRGDEPATSILTGGTGVQE
ncbi:Golgi apparatus membrane protein TVP18 [Smittium mucronatum]|uniref:Golgi apparatus membrane protein TVP18 n=1 Tax=Smittium mucronatum TaxID=133383 RepID=A0A1R0H2A0_9FUNG|nr:Golgi apparatus membrane protein TVP18 [Smittium mucronatum]OLY83275.1 Golgi apparatus membrane protein TVP18 [Smittium mucronatum]